MTRLADKDHLWYDMKVTNFEEVETALRAIERWANETSFSSGGYWTYDTLTTGRLEIDQAQVPGITEIYIYLPGEDSYLYLADFGPGSQLVELVAVEDLFITAGEDVHITSQVGGILLEDQGGGISITSNNDAITIYADSDISLLTDVGDIYCFASDDITLEAFDDINITADTGGVNIAAAVDVFIEPGSGQINMDGVTRWNSGEWKSYFDQGDIGGGSVTFNVGVANVQRIRMTANITSVTLTGLGAGYGNILWITLVQDGTGGRTITWPAAVKWPGGVAPTLTAAANGVDQFRMITLDSGTTWYATTVGLAFA